MLGKLPVPGRPTVLITVGQGPIALAVGAGGGGLDIFTLNYPFSSFSLSVGDGSILKYCRKGPLNPKQPTNLPNVAWVSLLFSLIYISPDSLPYTNFPVYKLSHVKYSLNGFQTE